MTARSTSSVFRIGDRDFVLPQLAPEILHKIREQGRGADLSDPMVKIELYVRDVYEALVPAYPDLTKEFLEQNLTIPIADAILANLYVQMELAIAARKQPMNSNGRA